jgi:hypothetical protein
MSNLLARAINTEDGEQAAKTIKDALGIESGAMAHTDLAKVATCGNVIRGYEL